MLTEVQSQDELEEILAVIKNSMAVIWHHVNMMGEYDSSRAALRKLLNKNTLRFAIEKLKAWEYRNEA